MSGLPVAAISHLMVAPILLPLATAALALVIGESRPRLKALVSVVSSLLGLLVAVALLMWVDRAGTSGAVGVYLTSNWEPPFGIVLALDRLSALMLVLTGSVSLASVLFSVARWHRAGVHYHPLYQIVLMGLNGAFLTADLFNLFVFFEVMLAASYGLLLHGSGRARLGAGLHYVAVNLLASSLFLIGVAIVYGICGTLNMADIAQKVADIPPRDAGLLHAGAALLGLALLVKAAIWPLNFWLAPAYAAASPPVAALFVLLTKVGVYAVLRLWTLLLAGDSSAPAFGGGALTYAGIATLIFGTIGMLASQHTRRLAGFSVIVSSGTLLAAIGFGHPALAGAALFYLLGSTLAISALFLLGELIERFRHGDRVQAPIHDSEAEHLPFEVAPAQRVTTANLDDDEVALIGEPIPAAVAFLAFSFIACALMIAGLPPLSGFLAKFAMVSALFDGSDESGARAAAQIPFEYWALLVVLMVTSLFSAIALSRAGVRHFWASHRPTPHLRVIECLPIAALLVVCAALTVLAEPVLVYTQAAAAGVLDPTAYLDAVMSAKPVPGPARSGADGSGSSP